ncbi:EF-hand domain-containing protein [Seonamhaeicola sp. NFXS20]|uniref:EF-hand domain-containing protein n=1 Tax=unclassified Seonamhaeicola TaxID=2622645 RepID=UPI00356A360E
MNYIKTLTTIFSMLICVTLFAQGPPGGGRGGMQGGDQQRGGRPDASEILSMLDTNSDDLIDKDEAAEDKRGKIAEDFDEIDTDDDGFINLEELEAFLNNRKGPKMMSPEKLIEQVDDNGDGTLNELEVAAKQQQELVENFEAIDTNDDKELDIDELKAFYESKENNKKRKRRN